MIPLSSASHTVTVSRFGTTPPPHSDSCTYRRWSFCFPPGRQLAARKGVCSVLALSPSSQCPGGAFGRPVPQGFLPLAC